MKYFDLPRYPAPIGPAPHSAAKHPSKGKLAENTRPHISFGLGVNRDLDVPMPCKCLIFKRDFRKARSNFSNNPNK
jgi:hypothetical protein